MSARLLIALTALPVFAAETRPFEFGRDIGGILTRRGCNNATCHGGVKGRGGFKLSPAALYPKDDYEWIVKGGTYQVLTTEVAGERKPRIEKDSAEYRAILEWIKAGAPLGLEPTANNRVARLELVPNLVTLDSEGT